MTFISRVCPVSTPMKIIYSVFRQMVICVRCHFKNKMFVLYFHSYMSEWDICFNKNNKGPNTGP